MSVDFGGVFGVVCVLVGGGGGGAGVGSGVVELLVELERSDVNELILPHVLEKAEEPEDEVPNNDFGLGVNGFDLVFAFALEGDEEVGRRGRV